MNTAKEEVKALLDNLPENCSLKDIQYHLYVVEKIHRGIERAEKEGTLSQDAVERKFDKWLSKYSGHQRPQKTLKPSQTIWRATQCNTLAQSPVKYWTAFRRTCEANLTWSTNDF